MAKRRLAVGTAPHVCFTVTTSRRMIITACCLFLPILQSSFNDNFSSIFIAAAAIGAAIAVELLLNLRHNQVSIADGSAIVTALVLTLLMPNTINPLIAAIGAGFAILITKWSFGGLGANWFNPAAAAWLFLRQCWPAAFTVAMKNSSLMRLSEAVSRGTVDLSGSPATILRIIGSKTTDFDTTLTRWLNENLLIPLGAELPNSYFDLFIPHSSGFIADRGLLVLLPATIVLISASIIPFYIPLSYLLSYTVAVRIWGALPFGGALFRGDMLFGISTGAVLLGAFLLIGDPAVSPKSRIGKILIAILAGLFSFVFRYGCGEAYGVIAAVLLMNMLTPLFRQCETWVFYTKRRLM